MSTTRKNSTLFVVLNFNGWQETLVCIDSIKAQSDKDFRILLIDNGSHDESLEKLRKYNNDPLVTFHKEPVNLGFAGGVNVGIRKAIKEDFEYIVLLNNDATLTKPWLAQLKAIFSKDKTIAVVTGLLLESTGELIESTGDSYSSYGLPFPRQRGEHVTKAQSSGYVFGGTAGASIYKTSLFKDIGLFDETFFAYFEDTDISYRAQLAGYKAYYEKDALAYHDHGTTSGKMPGFTLFQTFKNQPVFLWKNVPIQLFFGTAIRFYACYGLMYIRSIVNGQAGVATKGMIKSIGLFPHALRERRRIQQRRKVSIGYLKSIIHQGLPTSTRPFYKRIFHR